MSAKRQSQGEKWERSKRQMMQMEQESIWQECSVFFVIMGQDEDEAQI